MNKNQLSTTCYLCGWWGIIEERVGCWLEMSGYKWRCTTQQQIEEGGVRHWSFGFTDLLA